MPKQPTGLIAKEKAKLRRDYVRELKKSYNRPGKVVPSFETSFAAQPPYRPGAIGIPPSFDELIF